jgi:hypothetical protein
MFMRYVHTEDDPVRAADEAVAFRRLALVREAPAADAAAPPPASNVVLPSGGPDGKEPTAPDCKPLGLEDGDYRSRTKLANYGPFRHRGVRTVPFHLVPSERHRRLLADKLHAICTLCTISRDDEVSSRPVVTRSNTAEVLGPTEGVLDAIVW